MRKNFQILSWLVMLSLLLAACAPAAATATEAPAATEPSAPEATQPPATTEPSVPAGPKVLVTSLGPGDVATLDPAVAQDVSSTQIVQETFIGMTNLNEINNLIEPGIATSWDIVNNADGTQTITLHLRDDVP